MNRRGFLGFGLAAVGGVFVPQFGQWYRRGSGLVVQRGDWVEVIWSKSVQYELETAYNLEAAYVKGLQDAIFKHGRKIPTGHLLVSNDVVVGFLHG